MQFDEVKRNLEARGYAVSCFPDARQAMDYLDAQIDGKTVGLGGSVTLEQLGAYERLSTHNAVHWHHRLSEGQSHMDVRAAANAAEVYVSSVNALARTGEIVNIDHICNRVAAISYGPKKVYLAVGRNKLAESEADALYRARNIAGPLNAKRLNRKTPCAVRADRCYDCDSPDRICRGLSVLWRRPAMSDIEILLIDEDLGY